MNQNQDSHVIFQELLTSSLNKLIKMLPKQMVSLKTLIEKSLEQIEQTKNDVNRFSTNANKYFIIYKYCLDIKHVKITECCLFDLEKLISQNFIDGYSYDYIEVEKGKQKDRMLIDSIVESVVSCTKLQEENLHYLIVKCIDALFKQQRLIVTGETLGLGMKTYFQLYKQGMGSVKNSIKTAIDRVFDNAKVKVDMEQMQNKGMSWNYIYDEPTQVEQIAISDDDIVEYISLTLKHMVDDVVLYNERLKTGQQNIPIASVPQAWEAEDIKYKNYIEIKIQDNEGITSGKFGWCILCRQPAPYFCKDTRVPVCSVPCKKRHFEMIENIKILQKGQQNQNDDCQIIFKYLTKKANKEKNVTREISLDFIAFIVEKYPIHLSQLNFDENFINMMCLNLKSKRTSQSVFKILKNLIFHARDFLQAQLEILFEFIFNKLPNDQCSNFLDFVLQLIEFPKLLLELFTNHDCVIERKNIIQPLFEKVAQIAQGEQFNQENCLIANSIIQKQLSSFIKLVQDEQQSSIAGLSCEQIEEQNQDQLKKMIKNIERHEKQLTYKQQIHTGLQRFADSWKEGLDYFFDLGILDEKNHNQIAQFFLENKVNKDQLGQYFGSSKESNQLVFQIYSQSITFCKLHIVDALRKYLNYFTLPGEAQQVDRCMLVFSQKFYQDNPDDVFKTSDETYVFSYLLIILQTDVHNKSVKNKMTLQQFCKSSMLSMERDLGEDYLKYCYDSILKEPLAIHESIDRNEKQIHWVNLERKSLQQKIYIFMPRIDYIKLFMEVFWPALFVNLNVTIERTENIQIINIAMQNATYTLQLMSLVGIGELCQSFIQWLCQLASLENKQLKQKNYKALQCIIDLAIKNGNALKNNWRPVLEIISSINFLLNEKQKGKILSEPLESISKNIQNMIEISSIDKVMQNTSNMDSRTIIDFLQSLIDVSLNEITLPEPRIFSLQRLVEVTSFNMDRIRLIWMQIWNLLKAHFVTAGIHTNQDISLYACDQLKQMSVKFIQQYEHNNFKFQMEFLQPFELIYAQTPFQEVKEFILSCMRMLSHVCYYKLKSGWRIVFRIINQSLQESVVLVDISLDMLNKVFSEDLINLKDIFDEIDQTFQYLFNREEQHVLLKGIEFVQNAVESLMKSDSNLYYTFWMQSLAHICNLFQNNQQQIQEQAIQSFFKILKSNTKNIKGHQYVQIMKGMMKELFLSLNKTKKEICQMAHKNLLELVFDHDIKEAYDEISTILLNSTSQNNENLAKTSVMTFKSIIIKEGKKLDWDQTISVLDQMVQNTTPQVLFDASQVDSQIIDDLLTLNLPKNQIRLNSDQLTLKCILQLMLIDIIQDIVDHHINLLKPDTFTFLLTIAKNLYSASFKFNRQIKLRYFLQQQGFMPNLQQLPGLIKQEKSAAIGVLNLLNKQSQMKQDKLIDLIQFILEILEDTKILGQIKVNQQFKSELEKIVINNLSILQISIIPILNQIDLSKIHDQIKILLSYFVQLPSCYSLLISQCPHCQTCPYQCSQKKEWKKLFEQIQQIQLTLLQYL